MAIRSALCFISRAKVDKNTFCHIHKTLNIFIILSAIFIILSPIRFLVSDIYNGLYHQTNLSLNVQYSLHIWNTFLIFVILCRFYDTLVCKTLV